MNLSHQKITEIFLTHAPFTDLVGFIIYMILLLEESPEARHTLHGATVAACWVGDTLAGRGRLLDLFLPPEIMRDDTTSPILLQKANLLLEEYREVMKESTGSVRGYLLNL